MFCWKSWVWKYVVPTKDEIKATSKICGDTLSYNGSTSALNKHLKYKHKLSSTLENDRWV